MRGANSFVFGNLRLFQGAQRKTNIGIEQNGLRFKAFHGDSLAQIDAGVSGCRILGRHAQEGHFDNAGGIAADAKLQEQNMAVPMPMQEILIPLGCGIPALILNEVIVTAQIHSHGPAALGATRNQAGRDTHFRLLCNHPTDSCLVIISCLMTRLAALPKAVITLGVEQPRLIKSGQLKLMVHIGGQDKIIPAPDQIQQVSIRFAGCHIVTVVIDVSAPPGPVFLQRGKRIEPAGIDIGDAILLMEVGEVFQKALAAIGQASRCGKAGACADEDGIRALYLSFQPLDFL